MSVRRAISSKSKSSAAILRMSARRISVRGRSRGEASKAGVRRAFDGAPLAPRAGDGG